MTFNTGSGAQETNRHSDV